MLNVTPLTYCYNSAKIYVFKFVALNRISLGLLSRKTPKTKQSPNKFLVFTMSIYYDTARCLAICNFSFRHLNLKHVVTTMRLKVAACLKRENHI